MYGKYRTEWCTKHGTTPSPDLRRKYLQRSRNDGEGKVDFTNPSNQSTTLSSLSVGAGFLDSGKMTSPAGHLRSPSFPPRSPTRRQRSPSFPPRSPTRVVTSSPSTKVDTPRDVMISYSHADKEVMTRLRDALETKGISVWVDTQGLGPGVNFLSTIGQAIIDAKLFITMVSRSSIKSKFCQDELALAYVSAKPIFPVALEDRKTLFPLMATGTRLQLAGYKWTMFQDSSNFGENFEELFTLMKEELENISDRETDNKKALVHSGSSGRPKSSRRNLSQSISISVEPGVPENPALQQPPETFWSERFGETTEVDWTRFWSEVCRTFKEEMLELYGEDRMSWLVDILKREMEVEDNSLKKENFLGFCSVEGEEWSPFWIRMEDQAKESAAMEEVFDMESSVRMQAIENLAKFKSPAVVDALQSLLTDTRADVRAVAAICMARIGSTDDNTVKLLRRSLRDHDRLVREAGCIAVGKLKMKSALKDLLHIWRNDVIADVRASAELALQQIGGPEVEKEMKVTQVLSEEIKMLMKRP